MNLNADKAINQAVELINFSNHIVIFTGAGLSTRSGIADFRSKNTGLWEHHDPLKTASLTTFNLHPEVFYNWLRPLARDIWRASPNPAHQGVAWLESSGIVETIITQNIDGLHQRAGSKNIAELHGSLNTFSCPFCKKNYPSEQLKNSFIQLEEIPICRSCQSVLKPDIVLFEEALPAAAWTKAQTACQQCDLMIVLGSSLNVYPAAHLPTQAVLESKARLIIINLGSTPLDEIAEITIRQDLVEVIPLIVDQIK